MRAHNDPAYENFPTTEEIDEDLALLQGTVHAVRTYSVEGTLAAIPGLADARGLNVTLGAWIGSDPDANEVELARFREILPKGYRNLVRVMVGNEAILREDVSVAELTAYLDRVRKMTWLPVSTAEPWHIWLKYPELAERVDFITVHLLPYWEGVPVDQAVGYAVSRFNEVKNAFPDKEVIIGEVGWPSNGRRNRGAEASLTNQTRFLRRFLAHAEQADYERKVAEREARAERKPPKAPERGPRATDQVNLTDAESRIMPTSGGGFRQFLLRGLDAGPGEWALACLGWNLKRLFALKG